MLKGILGTASALAVAVAVTAVSGLAETATSRKYVSGVFADPKCKNKVNQYVACTGRLRAKPQANARPRYFQGPVSRFSAGQRH